MPFISGEYIMGPMGNRRWLYFWWRRGSADKHIIERGGQKSLDHMKWAYTKEDLHEFFKEAERIGLIVDDFTGIY